MHQTSQFWVLKLLIALAVVGLTAPVARAFDHEGLAQRALERHIVPGYQRLIAAADKQWAEISAVCKEPSNERVNAARDAFKGALVAWGHIEHIRFGPITEHNRLDAMIFWPDPRGIARRQIGRLLTRKTADALSPEGLAGKSVAVQGFSALDVVLFGPGSEVLAQTEPVSQFRCGYALALAANIATNARQTLEGWTSPGGFAALWLYPAAGNAAFLSAQETTHALVQAYLSGVKQLRNVRLGGPLGLKEQGIRPLDPIMSHSGMGMELLAANVEGLRALLVESDFEKSIPEGEGARGIVQSVVVELDMTHTRMREIAKSSPDSFHTARSQLMALGWPLRNVHAVLLGAMAKAAGFSVGFNSLDGD